MSTTLKIYALPVLGTTLRRKWVATVNGVPRMSVRAAIEECRESGDLDKMRLPDNISDIIAEDEISLETRLARLTEMADHLKDTLDAVTDNVTEGTRAHEIGLKALAAYRAFKEENI